MSCRRGVYCCSLLLCKTDTPPATIKRLWLRQMSRAALLDKRRLVEAKTTTVLTFVNLVGENNAYICRPTHELGWL